MTEVPVADRIRDLSALFEHDPITLPATITMPESVLVPKVHGEALSVSPTDVLVRVSLGYDIYCRWTRCGFDWAVTEVFADGPSQPHVIKAPSLASWRLRIGSYR